MRSFVIAVPMAVCMTVAALFALPRLSRLWNASQPGPAPATESVPMTVGDASKTPELVTMPEVRPVPEESPVSTSGAGSSQVVAGIRQAADPDTVEQTYEQAVSSGGGDMSINQAYVNQMVQLGMPGQAEDQAEAVVAEEPSDSVSWAVLAYTSGARNDTTAALAEIATAIDVAPAEPDPFVLHTAGQLLAWYHRLGREDEIADEPLRITLRTVHERWRTVTVYQEAYARAYQYYGYLEQVNAPVTETTELLISAGWGGGGFSFGITHEVVVAQPAVWYPYWETCYVGFVYPSVTHVCLVPRVSGYVVCHRDVHRHLRYTVAHREDHYRGEYHRKVIQAKRVDRAAVYNTASHERAEAPVSAVPRAKPPTQVSKELTTLPKKPPLVQDRQPDAGKKPDAGPKQPDAGKKPAAGPKQPDAEKKPVAGPKQPDAGKKPDAGRKQPDSGKKPDAGPKPPDAGKKPDAGPKQPDAGKKPVAGPKPPDAGKTPDAGPKQPDAGKKPVAGPKPQDAGKKPAAGPQQPDAGKKPVAGPKPPDAGKKPDTGPKQPDAGKKPAAGPKQPDAGKKPDAGPKPPDAGKKPDAGPKPPDAGKKPDAGPKQPDAGKKPDAGPKQPDAGKKPDAGPKQPDAGKKPDAGPMQPGGGKKPAAGPKPPDGAGKKPPPGPDKPAEQQQKAPPPKKSDQPQAQPPPAQKKKGQPPAKSPQEQKKPNPPPPTPPPPEPGKPDQPPQNPPAPQESKKSG